MNLELAVALVALVSIFVIATTFNINVGLIAFAAAFIVGVWVSDLEPDDLLSAFPANLFVLLVGITYLFGIARANGTIAWLAHTVFRLSGGRVALLPWMFFLLAAAITAFGGLPASTIAIVAPLAMACAAEYKISPFLMGLLVIHGTQAGSVAPISPIGIIVNDAVEQAGLPDISTTVFLNQTIFVTALCVLVYFIFGGRELIRRGSMPSTGVPAQMDLAVTGSGSAASHGGQLAQEKPADVEVSGSGGNPGDGRSDDGRDRLDAFRVLTLVGIAVFAVLALGFDSDAGFTAFIVAFVLTMFRPSISDQALKLVAWPIVLLICGIVTFIGVMDQIGAIDALSDGVEQLDSPMVAALSVSYVGAITSLFSTTAGVIGAAVPLIIPSLGDMSSHQVAGTVSAVTISSSVVDTSPVSGNGAIVLANLRNHDTRAYFKKLMAWGVTMMVVGPLLSWLVFVVVGVP